ncbi:hypothetical protein ABW21_db0208578 [Orbilia brochopaga]|nr:hypothetical protein ABW21_db0208578 [Drechslerella brochopaga]
MIPHLYGVALSKEHYEILSPLIHIAGALSTIINDIVSVEKEWIRNATIGQAKQKIKIPTSAVYIILRTQAVNLTQAKQLAREKVLELEQQYLDLRQRFLNDGGNFPLEKTARFISGLDHIVSGNLVWHTNHRRYYYDLDDPFCPEPEHRLRDFPLWDGKKFDDFSTCGNSDNEQNGVVMEGDKISLKGVERNDRGGDGKANTSPWIMEYQSLPDEIVLDPFQYIKSLPSKKIRNYAIDALDIWYRAPQSSVDTIINVVDILHSASLM